MKLIKVFGLLGLSSGEEFLSDERNDLPGPFGRLARRNVPCQWAGWCDWSPCAASCGKNAVQSRTRECICDGLIDPASRGCLGEAHEGKPCGDITCPEEKAAESCWTDWSEWGACCGDCGGGERSRSRACTCGPPGCANCPGEDYQYEDCPELKCSTGDWMPWSECSASCGDGSRSRSRDCVCPDGKSPDECGGCGDELLAEDEPCNNGVCPSACDKGNWEPWGPCSTTCGEDGTRARKRPCGSGCDADKEDERPEESAPCDASDCAPCPKEECDCSVPACDRPKDCECTDELKEMCAWTAWSGFCGCSATCDEGIQARTRKCFCGDEEAIGLPQPGCEGEPQEEVSCNEGPCDPTENCLENGLICSSGQWSDFGPCDAPCGETGQQTRERSCECPEGIPADHEECGCDETSECKTCRGECDNEPETWTNWSPCECEMEKPERSRFRECDSCDDSVPLVETETCPPGECVPEMTLDDCLGDWEDWGPCDAVCGVGTRTRERPCKCGQSGCPGCEETTEEEECIGEQEPCEAGPWSEYGECEAKCDEPGQQFRTRECFCPPGIDEDHPDCGCENTSDCKSCVGTCSCPTEWEPWSPCDGICGSGYREKLRYNPCDPNPDAPPEVITEPCAEEPIMCVASEWSEFGECDAECDGFGQMTRNRECACPEGADEDDEECGCGELTECKSCQGKPCNCWGEWAPWSPCDGPCGGGKRTRESQNICDEGAEPKIEEEECEEILCTPGDWSEWTECDAEPGEYGQKFRERDCSCPPGGDELNPDCGCGDLKECLSCKGESLCEWSPWSEPKAPCTSTCGGGTQPRDRTCNERPKSFEAPDAPRRTCDSLPEIEEGCPGAFMEQTPCSVDACPPKCEFGEWSCWSDCSATCGGGKMSRDRPCNCPEGVPESECENNGQCEGEPIEEQDCNTDVTCPPECEFGDDWAPWGPCTTTCGPGSRQREKGCDCKSSDKCDGCEVPEGSNPDDFLETGECPNAPCTCWGDWAPWSECPNGCGTDTRTRERPCICEDEDCNEEDNVEQEICPGDSCMWSCWSEWSECLGGVNSLEGPPCGESTKKRTRTCDCPPGVDEDECGCEGPSEEEEPCDLGSCEDLCYTQWSPWSPCGECGGLSTRERECKCEAEWCQFTTTEMNECPDFKCKPGQWSEWSGCTATCGPRAIMTKTRECNCPEGANPIACGCDQDLVKERKCPNVPDECPPECSDWCNWSECECKTGEQTRVRECDENVCRGREETPECQEREDRTCPDGSCDQPNCGWTEWCSWSDCDKTCGSDGTRVRTRNCDCEDECGQDERDEGCPGDAIEEEPCVEVPPCDFEGSGENPPFIGEGTPHFTPPGSGDGDSECGEDELCNGDSDDCVGPDCSGSTSYDGVPPLGSCEFDEWCPWSECTKPCNGGTMTRSRDCPCGNCEGDTYEVKDCNTQCCPDLPEAPEDGKYCSSRINYRTKEPAVCCDERNDECTFDMGDGRKCFCDNYCAREESDCCPDYAESCLNVHPTALPPPVYTTREPSEIDSLTGPCYDGTRIVPLSTQTRENCKSCGCRLQPDGSVRLTCDSNICIVDPELIKSVNSSPDASWTAGNYSFFWGKTLSHGYRNYLGTAPPSDSAEACETLEVAELPSTFDFTSPADHVIPQNLHQEDCGASFAFSFFNLVNFKLLSTNQRAFHGDVPEVLNSCGNGCTTGDILDIHHAAKTGFWPESGLDNICPMFDSCVRVSAAKRLACTDDIKREIATTGPVIAYMNVTRDFFLYQDGIYRPTESSEGQNHLQSVVLLGWGDDYWLARNSWSDDSPDTGSAWGMCLSDGGRKRCGFVKLAFGVIDSSYVVTIPVDTSSCDHSGEYNESV